MGLPSLILGIIFMTAGSHWFAGAATVGLILTIISSAILASGLLILGLVVWAQSSGPGRRF